MRVLFASRAFESVHSEGGFLILRDLACRAGRDEDVSPAFLSLASGSCDGVDLLPVYHKPGWSLSSRLRFAGAVRRHAADYDIVHTAHVPTPLNASLLARIRKRNSGHGTKYVQTVTALPAGKSVSRDLFWGDAIVCLNDETAATVSNYHARVTTIDPVPSDTRLQQRRRVPDDVAARLQGKSIVCVPVDFARIGDALDIAGLCRSLLQVRPDIALVFACRFGEESQVRRLADSLQAAPDRVHVFGEIDWMTDLIATSDVLLYPIADLGGKFNPPMVLLEAAALGCPVVTSTRIAARGHFADGGCHLLDTDDADAWLDAVIGALQAGRIATASLVSSDAVYVQYCDLYRSFRT